MAAKLYREIHRTLVRTGLPFQIEEGTKHHLVYVQGEHIYSFPKGGNTPVNLGFIQRALRQHQAREQQAAR